MTSRRKRYTTPDFWFTEDGDFKIDSDGDLKDTLLDETRAVIQEVRTVVSADSGDWVLYPKIGANLSSLRGAPASTDIGKVAAARITEALLSAKILSPEEFIVMPLMIEGFLIIRITIASPTGEVSINFGYDSSNKQFIGY